MFEAKAENDQTICLRGRIDSANAQAAEEQLFSMLAEDGISVLECRELDYIASSGLRILLKAVKTGYQLKMVNVNPAVYEVLEEAGFMKLIEVHKAYRVISVENCEVIGEGANGIVYRLDQETVVKVYKKQDVLPLIEQERTMAQSALLMGIPTAIAFDIVMTEDGKYGAVYELLASKSYAKLIQSGEKTVHEIAKMSTDLLKQIHAIVPEKGMLPSMKVIALQRLEIIRKYLDENTYEMLQKFFESIGDSDHLLHGDFHVRNVHYADGESILIDMEKLCTGDPVFEFAPIYFAYRTFADLYTGNAEKFFGISTDDAVALCDEMIRLYYEDDEQYAKEYSKIRLIAYCRLLRYADKTPLEESEKHRIVEYCRRKINACLKEDII